MVKYVNLKSSRYAFKPKIGQFGHLEPFFYFSTFLPKDGGGGVMVQNFDLEAFGCDLKLQIGQCGTL